MSDVTLTPRLALMLTELRVPTIKRVAGDLCQQSDKEGWPGQRLLEALVEHELAERETRRIDRHRAEANLSPDKRLIDCFDGQVVSWSIGTRPDAELVNTMLDAAIETIPGNSERPRSMLCGPDHRKAQHASISGHRLRRSDPSIARGSSSFPGIPVCLVQGSCRRPLSRRDQAFGTCGRLEEERD